MDISLETVEALAPDQSSLNAAKKLLKPAKWPVRGKDASTNTIWGQCQGSGANPYLTMADVVDHGYKCTCPSRKFPCKHVLALLWQFSDQSEDFVADTPPQWVQDWLGRRRRPSGASTPPDNKDAKASVSLAGATESTPLSPEELEKQEVARQKRAAKQKQNTDRQIREGLDEFRQWTDDQLRSGVGALLRELSQRCRQIASRLVDAKATGFASRVDELPAKVLNARSEEQPAIVFRELGQLVLLANAWTVTPDDPDTRRGVTTAENRDQLLDDPTAPRAAGVWQTVGERIDTRRDGLIRHATWLVNVGDDDTPHPYALLMDYYPAATGRQGAGTSIGTTIEAELVFYPSRMPLRAQIVRQEPSELTSTSWPASETGPGHQFAHLLSELPWAEHCPAVITGGRFAQDRQGRFWWQPDSGQPFPIANRSMSPVILGTSFPRVFVLWDGREADVLAVRSEQWGLMSC